MAIRTYRGTRGDIIKNTAACDALFMDYDDVCSRFGVEPDITATHCGDVAWESLVEHIDGNEASVIKGWNEFERAWMRMNPRREFPFVLMSNGYCYERIGDCQYRLAFDPDTIEERDGVMAPELFGDPDMAAFALDVLETLWAVRIIAPDGDELESAAMGYRPQVIKSSYDDADA